MKKVLYLSLISISILMTCATNGQVDTAYYNNGNKLVSYHIGLGNGIRHELRLENFFAEHWSLYYSLGVNINTPSRYNEIRPPLGISVGTAILFAVGSTSLYCGDGEFAASAFLAACLIPDGIAYHQKISDKFAFSPYINWTGINARLSEDDGSWQFSYSPKCGVRLMMNLSDRVMISLEETIQYRDADYFEFYPGFNALVKF